MHVILSIRDTKGNGEPARYMRQIPCVVYGDGKSFMKVKKDHIEIQSEAGDKTEKGVLVLIGDLEPHTDGNVAGMLFKNIQGIDNMIAVLNIARENLEMVKSNESSQTK